MMLIALTILASSSSAQHGLLRFFNVLTHQTPSPPRVSAIERGFLGKRPMNQWAHNTRSRLWGRCSALWGFPRCLIAVLLLCLLHLVNKILSGSLFCYALPAHPLLHDVDFSVSVPFQALFCRFFQLPERVVCEDRPPMFSRLKSAQDL